MKTFLTIRLAGLAALAFVMHAAPVSYLSPTPNPFFLSIAGFGLSGSPKIPLGPFQASNNISSNFTYVDPVHRFDGPDEIAQMTATFSGEIWNAAGTTDLGPYAATGDATFVFLGRTSDEPGSWTAEMTVDDLTVNAFGHYFNLTLGSTAMGRLSVRTQHTSEAMAMARASPTPSRCISRWWMASSLSILPAWATTTAAIAACTSPSKSKPRIQRLRRPSREPSPCCWSRSPPSSDTGGAVPDSTGRSAAGSRRPIHRAGRRVHRAAANLRVGPARPPSPAI